MERRDNKRYPLEASIDFGRFNGEKTFHAKTLNCSKDGMYLESDHFFREGTMILIRLKSFSFIDSAPEALEGVRSISLAKVKWLQPMDDSSDQRFGIGIKYY